MPSYLRDDGAGRVPALLWNPFSLLDAIDRSWTASSMSRARDWPHVDIVDREDDVLLVADVPGMSEDHLEITMQGQVLTIAGERPEGDGTYLMRGRPRGRFTRQFQLSNGLDVEHLEAQVEHGVLMVRVPKLAHAKPRRIPLTKDSLGSGIASKVKGLLGRDKDKPDA